MRTAGVLLHRLLHSFLAPAAAGRVCCTVVRPPLLLTVGRGQGWGQCRSRQGAAAAFWGRTATPARCGAAPGSGGWCSTARWWSSCLLLSSPVMPAAPSCLATAAAPQGRLSPPPLGSRQRLRGRCQPSAPCSCACCDAAWEADAAHRHVKDAQLSRAGGDGAAGEVAAGWGQGQGRRRVGAAAGRVGAGLGTHAGPRVPPQRAAALMRCWEGGSEPRRMAGGGARGAEGRKGGKRACKRG